MKVVKAEDVQVQNQEPVVDKAKIAEAQEKFDALQKEINEKKYEVTLNVEQTKFLLEDFFTSVKWVGYESYAISECYSKLNALSVEGKVVGKIAAEIVEALFHFLKNYEGNGFQYASVFKQICDQFALPMQEINQDRQNLRDASLEVSAAEMGIPVEEMIRKYEQAQQQQQRQHQ